MKKVIIVADQPWPKRGPFDPAFIPSNAHIEPYEVGNHWKKIGYFLLTADGLIIIDGVGIKSHRGLAQLYWTITNGSQYDEASFVEFEKTILGGWIWPPVPILFGSTSYPETITREQEEEVIRAFAPDGRLEFMTDVVFWDYGGSARKLVGQE